MTTDQDQSVIDAGLAYLECVGEGRGIALTHRALLAELRKLRAAREVEAAAPAPATAEPPASPLSAAMAHYRPAAPGNLA